MQSKGNTSSYSVTLCCAEGLIVRLMLSLCAVLPSNTVCYMLPPASLIGGSTLCLACYFLTRYIFLPASVIRDHQHRAPTHCHVREPQLNDHLADYCIYIEVHRKHKVHAKTVFSLSLHFAMVPSDVFVGLLPPNRVNTFSAHFTTDYRSESTAQRK